MISEKFSVGAVPNRSGPLGGAHGAMIWPDGPLMSIEIVARSADQSQALGAPRIATHQRGVVFSSILRVYTFFADVP